MKYVFTKETKILSGDVILRRIKALHNFGSVKKGDLGGWVENEENLSHEDDCWVSGNACIFDNARVSGHAQIYGNAQIYGTARVYDSVKIYGNAVITGETRICGCARVYGYANVRGRAVIEGFARVCGSACVAGSAGIEGRSRVYGKANVWDARICDSAEVCGKAYVFDSAIVGGQAKVSGNKIVRVYGNAVISGDAVIKCTNDYSVFKNTWTPVDNDGWGPGRYFTYTSSNKMWKDAGFYGTGKDLVAKAKTESKLAGECYALIVKTMEAIEKRKADAVRI